MLGSAAIGAGIALGACTTMGTGTGSLAPGDKPVTVAWKSTDGGITATMSAMLSPAGTS
jgi:hypothetical protein